MLQIPDDFSLPLQGPVAPERVPLKFGLVDDNSTRMVSARPLARPSVVIESPGASSASDIVMRDRSASSSSAQTHVVGFLSRKITRVVYFVYVSPNRASVPRIFGGLHTTPFCNSRMIFLRHLSAIFLSTLKSTPWTLWRILTDLFII